jgi:predicted TIM-barrel fold metal-dependent hydrolase
MEMVDADRLIALLDQAGIWQAAVLSLAYMYGNPNRPPVEHEYEAVKAENDWTSAQVAKFPDRLVAFCSVNPLRPYALEEIARCAADPRLKRGLKLHFGNSDVNLTDPADAARLREVFALANREHMAIVVHARTTISKQRPYGAEHARVFLETLLPAAPDVPVQIAHLAGSGGYDEAGRGVGCTLLDNGRQRRRAQLQRGVRLAWMGRGADAAGDLGARRPVS